MTIINLTQKLIQEGQKVDQFFLDLSESQLQISVYHDEQKWRIRDLLAHFIAAEQSFLALFENIINGGNGAPVDFSVNEFNNLQVIRMKDFDFRNLLSLFRISRRDTVSWLEKLKEEDLQITGRHPAMGESTLSEMIKMIYLHNQIHLRDIRKAINASQGDR